MNEETKLKDMFWQGKITRREFMTKMSALGLTAALSPALLPTLARSSSPRKGGRFRMALPGGDVSDTLDPAIISDVYMVNVNFQLRNCLVEVDHELMPKPELAESWDVSPDAVTWTFKLRKGIEFHNGKVLDSEDVLYTMNHHRAKDSRSGAKSMLASIEEIEIDGKHTIVFKLKEANADFPVVLSDYHLGIVPAGTKGKEWEKGIGTGGYILENFEPGVRTFVKRNPNYWKEGRAHFNEVETLNIIDNNARISALRGGKVDHMARPDPKTARMIKKVSGIELLNLPGTFHLTIPILTDVTPYDNNDVRLALKYAIDREQMVKTLLQGFGYVGNDHPIARIMRFYASDLPQREYDPDKAKYYLRKSGLEDHSFKVYAYDGDLMLDSAILFEEHATKAGLKMDVVRKPADGFWSDVWQKEPLVCTFWAGRPTADMMFSLTYAAGAPWNDTHWKHERFNKLLHEARGELNETKRHELYVEMQEIVRDEGGTIIHAFRNNLEAMSSKVKHGEVCALFETDGGRNAERWWFA